MTTSRTMVMSRLLKYLATILLLFLLARGGMAQDNYVHALGIRAGNPLGLSYKRFIGRYSVLEGISGVSFSYNDNPRKLGGFITGLYQYHFYLTEGLNWFAGGGLSLGGGKDLVILNADVILGLDYTISNFPINFSLDYKPYYSPLNRDIVGWNGFGFNEFALTIRYVIY